MRRRGRDAGRRDPVGRAMDRMMDRGDNIGALCLAVRSAGLTMRLNGVAVKDADELRAGVLRSAAERWAAGTIRVPFDVVEDPESTGQEIEWERSKR